MFYRHLNAGFRRLKRSQYAKRVKLVMAGTTFGSADLVVVWQAKDMEASKAFMDSVLVGTNSSNSMLMPPRKGFG